MPICVYILIAAVIVFALVKLCKREHFVVADRIEPVWTYWENPPGKTTPKIVRRCYRNWKNIGKVKDLRILTPENLSNFIPQSEIDRINYSCQGNLAVKSDFIGLFILHRYGGTMIDGTVYMHSPLSSWLPKAIGNASFFCFEGKRYSKGGICPETFFMYSKPGSLLAKEWYSRIHQVGASQDIDRFINRLEQKYPDIAHNFSQDNYLWVYLVGKQMLIENSNLKKNLNTIASEDDPIKVLSVSNWDTESACRALLNPQEGNITKLDNGLWSECDVNIVPV